MSYRRVLLAVLSTLTLGSGALYAQEPRNAISIDLFLPSMSPVSHLLGEDTSFVPINVKYQRMLTEHGVLMVKMGFTYSWDSDGERIIEISPMLAFDWHPFSTGLEGFYLGPSLFYNYTSYSHSGAKAEDDLDYSYWASVGGNIGYEFVLQSRIIIDLVFGLGYGYFKEVGIREETNASGFRIDETIGGVYVGYRF